MVEKRERWLRGMHWSEPLLALVVVALAVALTVAQGPPERPEEKSFGAREVAQAEAEMEAVGAAMLSWLTDQVSRAPGDAAAVDGPHCDGSFGVDLAGYDVVTHGDLVSMLVPSYIASVPELDPWGNPYDYRANLDDLLGSEVFAIRSAGSDDTFEGTSYTGGATTDPAGDLVWVDGFFARASPRLDAVSRQARTERDLQNVGVALMSWLTDQVGREPGEVAEVAPGAGSFDLTVMTAKTHAEIVSYLIPSSSFFYIRCVPELDGWGNAYEYFINDNLLAFQEVVALRSAGSDGTVEGAVYTPGTTTPGDDFHRDLVWGDGLFVQGPDGVHSLIFADDFESGDLWGLWSCQI